MKLITCERCGGNEFDYTGKIAICRYCGSKYADVARQASTHIALDDDVARLLAKCEAEPARARKYANLVLDIDPSNTQALKELKEAATILAAMPSSA